MSLLEIKIIKRGRKWFEAKEENEYITGKMLIDSTTGVMTVGESYCILGSKKKESNRYGTTIIYTCEKIPTDSELQDLKDKIKNEKLIKLALSEADKYYNKITKYDYEISTNSTVYKNFKYTIDNNINVVEKNKVDDFYIKINDTIKFLAEDTQRVSLLNDLLSLDTVLSAENKEFIIKKIAMTKAKLSEEKRIKEIKDYNDIVSEQLKNIEIVYDKGIYTEMIPYRDIMNQENTILYYKLKAEENNFNKSATMNVVNNLFQKRNEEGFNKYIENIFENKPIPVEIEKLFDKYAYESHLYILNYHISDIETFKELINKDYIERIDIVYCTRIYIVKNPFRVFDILVKNNMVEIKDEMIDEDIIKLWSRSISNSFTYRKEKVYEDIYYFVKEKKIINWIVIKYIMLIILLV